MSYTPPTYVDTKAQAILALASVVADEDKTALGDGSVNKALDVLADAMAEHDVSVPQTNAGAILALAQYIGGGGGGTTLGTVSGVIRDVLEAHAGDSTDCSAAVVVIKVGNQVVTDSYATYASVPGGIEYCAAGATVDAVFNVIFDEPDPTLQVVFRWCTIDEESNEYLTMSDPIDLAASTSIKTVGMDTCNVATFTMPEPPANLVKPYLLLSPANAS